MGVDLVGVDLVRVDLEGSYRQNGRGDISPEGEVGYHRQNWKYVSIGFAVKWFSTASSCGTCTQQARHGTENDSITVDYAGFTTIELTRVR